MSNITKRPVNAAMEEVLYDRIPLLDHGYIIPVDYMGTMDCIAEAARVSYGEGTAKIKDNLGLLRYLYSHRHMSPFEMAEIKFEIKLPVFVMRQWIRHRTANVNEYSARYSLMLRQFYIPRLDNMAAQSVSNKQGRELIPMNVEEAQEYTKKMKDACDKAFETYEFLVSDTVEVWDEDGHCHEESSTPLARELSRIILPVNAYTKCVWKCDVRNLLNLISLRFDSHAQYEIRVYAEAIFNVVQKWMPEVAAAFVDYTLEAYNLSRMEVEAIKYAITTPQQAELAISKLQRDGATKREINQFRNKFLGEHL